MTLYRRISELGRRLLKVSSPVAPLDALAIVAEGRGALDELERQAVHQAREAGLTWDAIAQALCSHKQVVHRRHASQAPRPKEARRP